ncbi:hypothetical protein BG006_010494 [Podila minutissima]|uniref:Uncharacterized protein n=1 Tax=Podila minutissima TaxID=64525 RepID=A0A9P5VI70_9FUNG|nr:hypothetical protein BG006_010494 [Podila minutissima]
MVPFPKPMPAYAKVPASSGQLVNVMHLSYWHVYAHYVPGSETKGTKPCAAETTPDSLNPLSMLPQPGVCLSLTDSGCTTPSPTTAPAGYPPTSSSPSANYGAYTDYTDYTAPGLRIMSLNLNFCYTMNFYFYSHTKDYDPNGQLKRSRPWRQVFPERHLDRLDWAHRHPHTDLNPGFRVYKVVPKTWNVHDSLTYIADIRKAAQWYKDNSTPDWHIEYSAREAYDAYVPINATEPLSASWRQGVTNVFEKNNTAFQTYWSYYNKQSPKTHESICAARADKSKDACTAPVFPLKREDEEADAADSTDMHSLYKCAEAKPWHKKQCGLTACY